MLVVGDLVMEPRPSYGAYRGIEALRFDGDRAQGRTSATRLRATPKGRKKVGESWKHLPPEWLETAAHLMLKLSLKDWNRFKSSSR